MLLLFIMLLILILSFALCIKESKDGGKKKKSDPLSTQSVNNSPSAQSDSLSTQSVDKDKNIMPLSESKYTKKDLLPFITEYFESEQLSFSDSEKESYSTDGYWIILEKGQLAGFANVTFLSSISCLYVLPEFRRYGLGKKLLFFLRDYLAHKYHKVFVSLVKKNPHFEQLREKSIEYGFDHLQTENYAGLILFFTSSFLLRKKEETPRAEKNVKRKKDELHFAPLGEEMSIMQMREKIKEIKKDILKPELFEDCKKKIVSLLRNFIDIPEEEFFKNKALFSRFNEEEKNKLSSALSFSQSEKEKSAEERKYSVLDTHFNYGENFLLCLADPACEAYCGSGSKNKKALNKTFMYFFNREFGRDFHLFVVAEPDEGFYPAYYAGPKEFTIKL